MELVLEPFFAGVAALFTPTVLVMALAGVLWGFVAGALPGIGSTVALGVMLPFTLLLDPVPAIAFLVAISLATGLGNSVPAILVGVPGSPSAFLTAVDGYELHRKGQSGLALGASYFATVAGQWLSIIFFALMVVPLSRLVYVFLSPELFALYALGLTAVVSLTGKNVFKGLVAASLGVLLSLIGRDPVSFVPRFHFGFPELRDGLNEVAVVIGVLAVSEILRSLRQSYDWSALSDEFSADFPKWSELRALLPSSLGGTVVGSLIGAIPGLGSTPASMVAYQQAKVFSKSPQEFGRGSPQAVAAVDGSGSASNATELVPTLGLGIPGSASMVMLLGAMTMQGIVPGPRLLQETPEMLSAAVAGMLGATIFMGLIGWQLMKVLLRVTLLDRSAVMLGALLLTTLGVYAINLRFFDVMVMMVAGMIGYVGLLYGYSTAALALGMILGSGFESQLRQGLLLARGDVSAFLLRPYVTGILSIAAVFLVYGIISTVRLARRERAAAAAEAAEHQGQ